MLSRFFIDRPVFATVLSVVIALIGGIALMNLPVTQYPAITPPGVAISINYPGASAQVVAETVAAPIEQQVNGVPGMLYMTSQMGNDGAYTLSVTFDVGADLDAALVMVQNRVALALPQLPTPVQNQGITVRKRTPDILMIASFYSPDGRYDDLYLSNYVTLNVRDEVLRVPGVSDVNIFGQRDYSIRIWLDPQKLAARNMTPLDVTNAIRRQNLDAPSGVVGQPPSGGVQAFEMPLATKGRLKTPEEFGDIIVRVGASEPPEALAQAAINAAPSRSSSVPTTPTLTRRSTTSSRRTTSRTPTSNSGASGAGSTTTSQPGATGAGRTPGQPAGATSFIGSAIQAAGDNSTSTTLSGATMSLSGSSTGGVSTAGAATPSTLGGGVSASGPGGAMGSNTANPLGSGVAGPTAASNSLVSGPTADRFPGRPAPAVVRLRDVARIELGAQNYNLASTFDGRPTVGLGIYQLPGTNALEVAEAVRHKLTELSVRFPDGVHLEVGYDITPFIRESVGDVVYTMLEAVLLVGIVVLVFLQDWKAMILPMIDVPVSIIGTFAVMYLIGFSLNNISLFGLVLAVGIVVDDAIVVLENVERLIAGGMNARDATIKAMDEVTGPIIAVAIVLTAVFVPCAFISGVTGQFYKQFAVTIAVSTIISAINATTMTPSRAVLIFSTEDEGQGRERVKEALPWSFFAVVGGMASAWFGVELIGRWLGVSFVAEGGVPAAPAWMWWGAVVAAFVPGLLVGGVAGLLVIRPVNAVLRWGFGWFNVFFDWVIHFYGQVIGRALKWSAAVLIGYGLLLVLTIWVFNRAPTGFVPQQDQGRLIVSVQLPDSASLERANSTVAEIVKITRETPGVAHVVAVTGMSFVAQSNGSNLASMFVVLKPFAERRTSNLRDTAIMGELQKRWAQRPLDAVISVFGAPPIPGLGVAGGFKIMVEDRGGLGLRALSGQVDELVTKLGALPELRGATTQFRANTPQLYLDVDRTKCAALGVPLDDVNQTLDIYLGSLYVNAFNEFGRHWQVTVQAEGTYRNRIEDVDLFQVRNNQGGMAPLGTLVNLREIGGPLSATRYNLYTSAAINGNIRPGVGVSDALAAVDRTANESLPITMKAEWTELMFMQRRAGNTGVVVFALSVVCVFLALAALYESWSLPLAVILVVPLSLLWSVLAVQLTGRDVNIFVQIGLIVLIGLACKNAILVVEYAKQLHEEGKSRFDATVEASRLRLRPILMTSFAFIFGVIPLTIAAGAGAEMRRSLGVAVFSGMLGVTVFGVFLTPVFYYVIQSAGEHERIQSARLKHWISVGLGAGMGALSAFLLYQLDVAPLWSGLAVGALAGGFIVLGVMSVHDQVKPLRLAKPPARRDETGSTGE